MSFRPYVLLAGLILFALGCSPDEDPEQEARLQGEAAIARARALHGADVLDRARVMFTFRGDHYEVERGDGRFEYARVYQDTGGVNVRDVLDNDGPRRYRDGLPVEIDERMSLAIEEQVNSVVYFALLPYKLGDDAVRASRVGTEDIAGSRYEVIEVTFDEEGGGRDWEDRFLYWFREEDGRLDYLAYKFFTGSGGTRFREAFNHRTIDGVTVADYRNWTGDSEEWTALEDYPYLLQEGRLDHVSDVIIEEVNVEPLN